jgi:PhzF family phenazine biosynthesis protein
VGIPFTQVDAFAAVPFAGNPAAVFVLGEPREDVWMQAVAREMNLSETAFLEKRPDGFGLRWFTPIAEVALCGHATLASAHVLWETGELPATATARFFTQSGALLAARRGEWIELDFPSRPESPATPPADLARALGASPAYVGQNVDDYLVLLASEADVRALQPDLTALRPLGVRGVIVTAPASSPGFDFVSRFFAPGVGVDEDPVTGSAHCCLAPFWEQRLAKREMVGLQVSARGGVVRVRAAGERVVLAGQAVTVVRGELLA